MFMKRKEFLTKSIAGFGGAVAFSALLHPQRAEEEHRVHSVDGCEDSARETKGPFPNRNPSSLVTRARAICPTLRMGYSGIALKGTWQMSWQGKW
jgi:hypothetical protein